MNPAARQDRPQNMFGTDMGCCQRERLGFQRIPSPRPGVVHTCLPNLRARPVNVKFFRRFRGWVARADIAFFSVGKGKFPQRYTFGREGPIVGNVLLASWHLSYVPGSRSMIQGFCLGTITELRLQERVGRG